jgi:hypothetical protein
MGFTGALQAVLQDSSPDHTDRVMPLIWQLCSTTTNPVLLASKITAISMEMNRLNGVFCIGSVNVRCKRREFRAINYYTILCPYCIIFKQAPIILYSVADKRMRLRKGRKIHIVNAVT